jgi:DNA repair protein RadD
VILRGYQREAIDALYSWFAANSGNPLLVLPTAAGKSVIQATFIHEAINNWPSTRILLVSHVKELLQQNVEKLVAVWPEAPIGIYSAGLKRRDLGYQITVAGIQSVHSKAMELGLFDLVIVDECHLIPSSGDGMYRTFIAAMRKNNPKVKVIGMTATHYRMKTGRLDQGEDALFDGIAYEVSVRRLIDEKYLCNLISKKGVTRPDLSAVGTRGGEFIPGQLEEAMDRDELTRAAADEIMALCATRKSWIIFCSGVDHAYHVRNEFVRRGVSASTVTGETPTVERAEVLARFKAGELRVLTNCDVLTTGFDAPNIDALIMLRPTKSTGLYVQMVGRGMRLSPETGKPDCLVLDYSGNIERHGPIDQIEVKTPRGPGDGNGVTGAPVKECPECQALVPIAVMVCPDCQHAFPAAKPPHDAAASFADILSQRFAPKIETFKVDRVEYSRHVKEGKPDSVRVDYHCGLRRFTEWVCLEHEGYARMKAAIWWLERKKHMPEMSVNAPAKVSDFFIWIGAREFPAPASIDVNTGLKYPEIVKFHDLSQRKEPASPEGSFKIDFSKLAKKPSFSDLDDDIPF